MIIPTLNAGNQIRRLIDSLQSQVLTPLEIIVIDSSSKDDTAEIARTANCEVMEIDRTLFNHGRSRNMAADLASGNVLVFLSQDALPVDETFLEELTRPIRKGTAVAVTARQIPFPAASPLEEYARLTNYPAQSHIRTAADVKTMGVMAYFFSNAASAVRKDVIETIGGFPEDVVVNEDMKLCANLLHAGYAVAYAAEAQVYHSHNFDVGDQFGRYFDIGMFFDQAGDPIESQNPIGRGRTFAFGQLSYLIQQRQWRWIPASLLESAAKYTAFQLGKRGGWLPQWVKRRLSRQKSFWVQPKAEV